MKYYKVFSLITIVLLFCSCQHYTYEQNVARRVGPAFESWKSNQLEMAEQSIDLYIETKGLEQVVRESVKEDDLFMNFNLMTDYDILKAFKKGKKFDSYNESVVQYYLNFPQQFKRDWINADYARRYYKFCENLRKRGIDIPAAYQPATSRTVTREFRVFHSPYSTTIVEQ